MYIRISKDCCCKIVSRQVFLLLFKKMKRFIYLYINGTLYFRKHAFVISFAVPSLNLTSGVTCQHRIIYSLQFTVA